ncbi:MAG: SDR family NAD(P)-dependent oxidoreductase [Cyclobacteriaceae bacterium]|nr:SDR family NAD(P)-dependent oxidoreductase [Cyclobacteriaceae bacterium]
MDINLSGKRAIVCGSTQGIGRAIAVELASLGASITLFARNEYAMHSVMDILDKSNGQKHETLIADFAFPERVKQAIDEYLAKTPEVHILVNNSGGPAPGQAIDADGGEFP